MDARLNGLLRMTATGVGAAALFWLLREHWRHVLPFLGYLPYMLFLACPLMHIFMHHGHAPKSEPRGGDLSHERR